MPNVLHSVGAIDLSVTVMGQKLAMRVYCSPTALQRLFHYQGERAVAAAAAKFGTMFGVSSLGTVSLEELRKAYDTPQVYQFYFHKDRALNNAMMQRAKDAGVNVMMLTVDSDRRESRTRPAHRIFHSLQAYVQRNASVRDQADVGGQLSHPRKVQDAAVG